MLEHDRSVVRSGFLSGFLGSHRGWFAAGFALLAVSGANAVAPPPLLQGVHKIVTVGASITQLAARPGGYVWRIQHTLDALYPDAHIAVIDKGVSGNTTGDMVARFKRDVLDLHPDLVTLKGGYNDLTLRFHDHPNGDGPMGHDAAIYGKNMETMVNLAEKAGIKVLIMTPTIYEDSPNSIRNQKLHDYVEVVRDIARRHHIPLADQNAALLKAWNDRFHNQPHHLTVDGTHLTLDGDAVLARTALLAMGIDGDQLDNVEPKVVEDLSTAAIGTALQ